MQIIKYLECDGYWYVIINQYVYKGTHTCDDVNRRRTIYIDTKNITLI